MNGSGDNNKQGGGVSARRRVIAAIGSVAVLMLAGPLQAFAVDPHTLAQQVGLDAAVVEQALAIGRNVRRLMGADSNGMERPANGITVEVARHRATAQAEVLRRALGPGYVVFVSRRRHGIDGQPDDVSVIRSDDAFDALRVMNTSGLNYELPVQRVIAKLRDWDRRYGLVLVGVGYDWVEARIKRPPQDMRAFAVEVYEFCPDVVSEIQSVDRLGLEIQLTRTVHLWWD